MASPTWPTDLPQCPNLNGLTEQNQVNVQTFQPDVGPPKLRRKKSSKGTHTGTVWRMTTAQVASFNNFYQTILTDGTSPFIWKHPYQNNLYSWWFDAKSPPIIERVTSNTFHVSFPLLRDAKLPDQYLFAGTGKLSVNATVRAAARANLQGAGKLTPYANQINQAKAKLDGTGKVGADVRLVQSLMDGAGQLTFTVQQLHQAKVSFAGAGGLTVVTVYPLTFDDTIVTWDDTTHTWDER